MATSTLKVELIGDASSLNRALGQTQTRMQKVGKAAGVAGAAIFAGLAVLGKKGFDELRQHAAVFSQVEAGIKSTGGAANVSADHIDKLSNALMRQSGIDDELIAGSQAILLTFRDIRNEAGKNNDVFDQASQAALDLSIRFGKDLNSSALILGKALNNPRRALGALTRVGVQFTKGQEDTIKALYESGHVLEAQKMILREVTKETGGSAAAFGKTLPGQIGLAKESFNDLAGQLVTSLLPAINAILEKALVFTKFLQENPKLAKAMVIALGALAAALLSAAAAQTILNLAVLANPYVAVAVAVIALGTAIAVLVKKVDFFRQHWQVLLLGLGVFPALVATVVKAVIRHFDTLVAAFNKVKAVAQEVWPAVKAAITIAISPILTLIRWINVAISAVRGLSNAIRSIPTPHIPGGGGLLSHIPGFARGGVVPGPLGAPRLAVVHGGETVIPTHRTGGMGGQPMVFNFPNYVGDRRELIAAMKEAFASYSRQNAGRSFI